jgi:hypothetical protein
VEELKQTEKTIGDTLATFLLGSFIEKTDEKEKGSGRARNKKKAMTLEELPGVKSERRERFKKTNNTFHIIKHYIEKENYKPNEEEMYLMKELAELKESSEQIQLDPLLKSTPSLKLELYKFMNEAVDFNELRLLCLLVVLAADVCYMHKDYNRAFYFYNQAVPPTPLRNSSLHTVTSITSRQNL